MQNQEATKDRLLITSELDIGIITEFAAICVDGWVCGDMICGDVLKYRIENSGSIYQVSLPAEIEPQLVADASVELLNLTLGLNSLGARVSLEGKLFHNHEKVLPGRHARPKKSRS